MKEQINIYSAKGGETVFCFRFQLFEFCSSAITRPLKRMITQQLPFFSLLIRLLDGAIFTCLFVEYVTFVSIPDSPQRQCILFYVFTDSSKRWPTC